MLIRFVVKTPFSGSLPATRGERENIELSRNPIGIQEMNFFCGAMSELGPGYWRGLEDGLNKEGRKDN
jgi:hypothetical protein